MKSMVILVPRELRPAYKTAVRAGWEVTLTGGDHLQWKSPDGGLVITPQTTHSRGHTIKNCLAELRRHGLKLGR